jgi:hypothetical protein
MESITMEDVLFQEIKHQLEQNPNLLRETIPK